MDAPKILILTPVKNCRPCLPDLFAALTALDYSRRDITIAFLENDSEDGSYEYLRENCGRLPFANVHLDRNPFGFSLPHVSRHIARHQVQRLHNISAARDLMLDTWYDGTADYIWWVDADILRIPPAALWQLVHIARTGKQVIMPMVALPYGGMYDFGTLKITEEFGQLRPKELINHIDENGLITVDYVSAMVFADAKLFDEFRFLPIAPGDQEGAHFSRTMRAKGVDLWWTTQVILTHARIDGTKES